jgi:hypothetical protein
MSNNFSISEWRRQQLHKEIIKEDLTRISENDPEADLKKYRKEVLQQLLSWYKKQDEPDQNMVKKLEKEIGGINENIDNADFKYGVYSKEEVISKIRPGSQVRWGSKLVMADELPDQVQFTKFISGIPTFLPVGKPKDMGDSSATIAFQVGQDIRAGKKPSLD